MDFFPDLSQGLRGIDAFIPGLIPVLFGGKVTHYTGAMRVRVLLFGGLKESMALPGGTVELADGATVGECVERCLENAPPEARKFAGSLAVAVNREYAQATRVLEDGDEVALLPPVSGGCAAQEPMVWLQREAIDLHDLLPLLKDGEDGAVVVFDGIVRNNTRGRRTLYLDYEAYEEMALDQMRALAGEAKTRFGVRWVVLAHRLGRLQVGETSVWIAVGSAHRAQAFDACRWMIDTLKKTVPIWKKEYFEDGAMWADGEPFPAGIGAEIQKADSSTSLRFAEDDD